MTPDIEQAIRFALERAANVCNAMWDELKSAGGTANTFGAGAVRGRAGGARELAQSIRSLAPTVIEEWNKQNAVAPQAELEAKLADSSQEVRTATGPANAAAPINESATARDNPYMQMVAGNHSIGVFKDGKPIAFDADVYAAPPAEDALELPEEPFEVFHCDCEANEHLPRFVYTKDDYEALRRVAEGLKADLRGMTRSRDFEEQRCAALEEELRGVREDAERFSYLQNCNSKDAQAFFWNYQSRKKRTKAIDAARAAEGQGGEGKL